MKAYSKCLSIKAAQILNTALKLCYALNGHHFSFSFKAKGNNIREKTLRERERERERTCMSYISGLCQLCSEVFSTVQISYAYDGHRM
jgi:hypothetical protein